MGSKGEQEWQSQNARSVKECVETGIFYLSRLRGKGVGWVVEWVREKGVGEKDGRARMLEA